MSSFEFCWLRASGWAFGESGGRAGRLTRADCSRPWPNDSFAKLKLTPCMSRWWYVLFHDALALSAFLSLRFAGWLGPLRQQRVSQLILAIAKVKLTIEIAL